MEPTLDQVRQELADIHDELLALATDAFDRRSRLKDRQNELRQLSHKMVDGQQLHDAAHLKAAYDRLHSLRDRLIEERIGAASTGDNAVWGEISMSINKAIDAGIGTDQIEKRLKEILGQLRSSS
jgi:cytochrome c556